MPTGRLTAQDLGVELNSNTNFQFPAPPQPTPPRDNSHNVRYVSPAPSSASELLLAPVHPGSTTVTCPFVCQRAAACACSICKRPPPPSPPLVGCWCHCGSCSSDMFARCRLATGYSARLEAHSRSGLTTTLCSFACARGRVKAAPGSAVAMSWLHKTLYLPPPQSDLSADECVRARARAFKQKPYAHTFA